MKPNRNFRFKNKKQIFAIVGFRYDEVTSLEYAQRTNPESIAAIVLALLNDKEADVISIRRVYLEHQVEQERTNKELSLI